MNSLYAAAADLVDEHDLPPEAIPNVIAILIRHKLGPTRTSPAADEVTTSEAARLLNVDRKTIRKYIDGGLLAYRDKAAPGSTQPRRLVRVADIERIKVYGFAAAPATTARRSRRPAAAAFKHLDLTVTF